MGFPYDRRSGSRGRRAVPLEVAEKIADERDALRAELQKVRRQRDRLQSEREAAGDQVDSLRRRAQEAERRANRLRQELADTVEALEAQPSEAEQSPSRDADKMPDESDVVRRLSRRIEELTKDLDRVERRTQKSVQNARREERGRLMSAMGDILDSTERALEMQGATGPWREGIEAIQGQLLSFLKAEGAELIGKKGEKLDPRRHEAVGVVESSEHDKGHIVDVERQGLKLEDDTVVRPARVIVAA